MTFFLLHLFRTLTSWYIRPLVIFHSQLYTN
jgi:hypothetical protein